MRHNRARRGIALVTALAFVLVAALIGRAIVALGPANLRMAEQGSLLRSARHAADCGVTYVQARMRENSGWKGDGAGLIVNQPRLQVVEDQGNIFGLVRGLDNEVSLFRARFNYQDGAGGPDGLDDPSSDHWIASPHISVNNLLSLSPLGLPGSTQYTVYPQTAQVVVEGMAGHSLRDLSRPDAPLPSRGFTSSAVQVQLSIWFDVGVPDAPLMAGGGFRAFSNSGVEIAVADHKGQPRLRTKGGIASLSEDGASANTITMKRGELSFDKDSQPLKGKLTKKVRQIQENVGDGRDFFNLKWDEVPAATADSSIQLLAGTYVTWDDGTLHYYDMNFQDYKTYVSDPVKWNDPGKVISSRTLSEVRQDGLIGSNGKPEKGDGKEKSGLVYADGQWTVSQNLVVVGSPKTSEFTVMSREGRLLHSQKDDPAGQRFVTKEGVQASGYSSQGKFTIQDGAVVSTNADVNLLLNVQGKNATLTTTGNAVLASTSVAFTKSMGEEGESVAANNIGAQSLSLYVKKNLTLSTYQPVPPTTTTVSYSYQVTKKKDGKKKTQTVTSSRSMAVAGQNLFGDLSLEGLVYVWGDVTAYAANPKSKAGAVDSYNDNPGKISLSGAMIAYGGNPENGQPGEGVDGNRGKVEMYGSQVSLTYDSSKLVRSLTPGGQLKPGPVNLKKQYYGLR